MSFLDWFAPLSPVARDGDRARIFSADACPLTYSFWVVDEEDHGAPVTEDNTGRLAAR